MTEALSMDPAMAGILGIIVVVLGVFGFAALRRRAPRPDQRPAEPKPDTQPLRDQADRIVAADKRQGQGVQGARDNHDGADPSKPRPSDVWDRWEP